MRIVREQDFDEDRTLIAAQNRKAAAGLTPGDIYGFEPAVEASGVPIAMQCRLASMLTFRSGKFIGFHEDPYVGKLQPGSLIFEGRPEQPSLRHVLFYFGIDNMPGSVMKPFTPEVVPGALLPRFPRLVTNFEK